MNPKDYGPRGCGGGNANLIGGAVEVNVVTAVGNESLSDHASNRAGHEDQVGLAALGLMAAGFTHDLGNLLQVVRSAIQIIDRRLAPAARTELAPFIGAALTSVDRAAALTRKILDLSNSDNAVPEPSCLDRTLASLNDLIVLSAGPHVTVAVSHHGHLPPIACDERELENVILNLVINARDAMATGGRLLISTHVEPTDGKAEPMVVLRVGDNGCGIADDLADRVFQPFFTTKGAGKGTGLGLAMVGDFARRAGGSAAIESVPGRGTTVILRLPVRDGRTSAREPA